MCHSEVVLKIHKFAVNRRRLSNSLAKQTVVTSEEPYSRFDDEGPGANRNINQRNLLASEFSANRARDTASTAVQQYR
jgi:hypothetical protein